MFREILRWIFLGAIYLFLTLVVARALDINLFGDANSEPNVTHYTVYRGSGGGGPYETIGTSPQTPATWFMADPSGEEALVTEIPEEKKEPAPVPHGDMY